MDAKFGCFHFSFFPFTLLLLLLIFYYHLVRFEDKDMILSPHVLGVSYGQAVSKRTLQNATKSALYSLLSLLCM